MARPKLPGEPVRIRLAYEDTARLDALGCGADGARRVLAREAFRRGLSLLEDEARRRWGQQNETLAVATVSVR